MLSPSVLPKLLYTDVHVKDLKHLNLAVLHVQHVELLMDGNEWQVMRTNRVLCCVMFCGLGGFAFCSVLLLCFKILLQYPSTAHDVSPSVLPFLQREERC